ncbi:MAG: acyl carrier protein [Anaerolineae bacterium]
MTQTKTLEHYITTTFVTDPAANPVAPDDNLLLSGLIDSLGVMQLVAFIQSENGIKVEPREITLKNFKTINSIVGFIERKKTA